MAIVAPALGVIHAVVSIAAAIAARIVDANEKRAAFTQETVKRLRAHYSDYNVVIIHTRHRKWGNSVHQHEEMDNGFANTTTGYEIYLSRIGDFFGLENLGDGGFINWAYSGYFKRDGNKILALTPSSSSPAGLLPGQSLHPGQSLQPFDRRHRLTLQSDGNVVLYTSSSQPIWATNTWGIQPRNFTMQTDGNLVLYDAAGNARWHSNTWNNPGAFFRVQDDGNLVIYRGSGRTEAADDALWHSGTFGR